MGDDDHIPWEERESRRWADQVAGLQEQVDDLQYQVLQLGSALVLSLNYATNVTLSISANEVEARVQARNTAKDLLKRIESMLGELPWSGTERPRLE